MASRVMFGRAVVRGAQKVLRCDKAAPLAEKAVSQPPNYHAYFCVRPLPEGEMAPFGTLARLGCLGAAQHPGW